MLLFLMSSLFAVTLTASTCAVRVRHMLFLRCDRRDVAAPAPVLVAVVGLVARDDGSRAEGGGVGLNPAGSSRSANDRDDALHFWRLPHPHGPPALALAADAERHHVALGDG